MLSFFLSRTVMKENACSRFEVSERLVKDQPEMWIYESVFAVATHDQLNTITIKALASAPNTLSLLLLI